MIICYTTYKHVFLFYLYKENCQLIEVQTKAKRIEI